MQPTIDRPERTRHSWWVVSWFRQGRNLAALHLAGL